MLQKALTICDNSKGQVSTWGHFDLISGSIIREPAWHAVPMTDSY